MIINEAFARKWFPNQDPLGHRITQDDSRKPGASWVTIVGVVGDIHHRGLDLDVKPEYYVPFAQQPYRGMTLVVRSKQDPRSLAESIRRELRQLDPEIPAANIRTLEQVASDSIAPRRLSVVLFGVFAGVALVLASVGIYGMMSFLVVQRTHELGVRMALGAQRADILRLVVGHAGGLILIGTFAGLCVAMATTRLLAASLYQVSPHDFATFGFVTVVLGVVALLASYIPAARVVRSDPMLALAHTL